MGKKPPLGCGAEIVKAAGIGYGERRAIPHLTLDGLFRANSPEEWRAEYAGAFDWGPDVGRGRRGMTLSCYVPDAADPVWTDFDPAKGREQAGRRPALVVSPAMFTENTGLAIVCPITSRVRPFPTSFVFPAGLPVAGESLTSHIRSIDTRARPIRYAGAGIPARG